jgi:hypothetical protein
VVTFLCNAAVPWQLMHLRCGYSVSGVHEKDWAERYQTPLRIGERLATAMARWLNLGAKPFSIFFCSRAFWLMCSSGRFRRIGVERNILRCLTVRGGSRTDDGVGWPACVKRWFLMVDSGMPRAARIPTSANIPVFAEGISDEYPILRVDRNIMLWESRAGQQSKPIRRRR